MKGRTMSLIKSEGKDDSVRINLTLPNSLYNSLETVIKENNLRRLDAIRCAVKFWVEYEMAKSMAEGQRANAKVDAELMEDFKHIDEELWQNVMI